MAKRNQTPQMSNTTTNTTLDPFQCYEHLEFFLPTAYITWGFIIGFLFVIPFLVVLSGLYLKQFHPSYKQPYKKTKHSISKTRKILVDAVKPFNAFAVIYFCICRWVWLFNPHAYSKGITGQIMYGKGLRNILVSTPQVVCLVAVTLLITLWRRVTNNAQRVRRQASSIKAETRIILGAIFYLMICLTVSFIAAFDNTKSAISNGLFGLYLLSLGGTSVYYICVLSNVVKKVQSQKAKVFVKSIQLTVVGLLTCSLLVVGGIAVDNVAIDRCLLSTSLDHNVKYLIFIWMVHLGEVIGCSAIAYAIFPTKLRGSKPRASMTGSSSVDPNVSRGKRGSFESSAAMDLEADNFNEDDKDSSNGGANGGANGDKDSVKGELYSTETYTVGDENIYELMDRASSDLKCQENKIISEDGVVKDEVEDGVETKVGEQGEQGEQP